MATYKIQVEEIVVSLATYWVEADNEEQAKTLWENGDITDWDRYETDANDELIGITLEEVGE